jgi:hypothetical protein
MDPSFAIADIRPQASYRYVYPSSLDHARIAYFFDYAATGIATGETRDVIVSAVERWTEAWADRKPPTLFYQRQPGRLRVVDNRSGSTNQAVLEGWHADAYTACCETARGSRRVHQELVDGGSNVSPSAVSDFLDECCALGIMVSDDDSYLALALPANQGW